MKKLKNLLVVLLAMIMCTFCLVACGEKGKYEAVSYTVAGFTKEVAEDDASYIELKKDNVAVVSIKVTDTLKWDGEGTWEKGEDGVITITVGVVKYNVTIDGKQ